MILVFSPYQDISKPLQNKVYNFKTGESFHFPKTGDKNELSEREKKVLNLISEGKLSKEIADNLCISVHTVNTHRKNILKKLKVKNSAEAVKLAWDYGLFD